MEREIGKDRLPKHLQEHSNNYWNKSNQQGFSLLKTILFVTVKDTSVSKK